VEQRQTASDEMLQMMQELCSGFENLNEFTNL